MTASSIFSLANGVAFLSWIFLVAGARWLPRTFGIVRFAVPIFFAALYIPCFFISEPVEGGGFRSLEAVMTLFTREWIVLGGWLHYLAFDFFVGCWILEKAKKEGIPHWLIIIPMLFTFMLGPVGLLLFLILLGTRKALAR